MARNKTQEEPATPTVEPRRWVVLFEQVFWLAATGVIFATLVALRDSLSTRWPFAVGVVVALVAVSVIVKRVLFPAEFEEARRRVRQRKEAKLLVREARRILQRRQYRIKPEISTQVSLHVDALSRALEASDYERIRAELGTLDDLVDTHLAFARKSTLREYAESIGFAVLIALLLRSFVVEAFKIPSGSMIPTLAVGDHIFVNKFIYGLGNPYSGVKFWLYGKPGRGDVVVFKYPEDPDKDFIKRIIAVEGDTVEINDGVVSVNGKIIPRQHVGIVHYVDIQDEDAPPPGEPHKPPAINSADEFLETIDGKTFSIYLTAGTDVHGVHCQYGCGRPIKVPPGHVFVMGDNRDNSHDSRYWGFVPDNYIKGRALFVWYSGDPSQSFPLGIRPQRFLHVVK